MTRRSVAWLALMLVVPLELARASQPWRVTDYSMSEQARVNGPHVLLIYDMEGLSGQSDIRSSEPEQAAYPQGRRLLTDDVNAVIRGLFAGGAKVVSVADGHGGGVIDVLTDELDARARMITRKSHDVYAAVAQPEAIDAIVAIGMHARSGSGGFWAHTYTWGLDLAINGQPVSESVLLAMAYGEIGVPLILVSGDDVLGRSLRQLPWVEYVTVKQSSGPATTVPIPLPQARNLLTQGAQRAVERLSQAKVIRVTTPVKVAARAVAPWSMSWLGDLPGVDYRDNTVWFAAANFPAAYRGIKGIGAALIYSYYDVMEQVIGELPSRRDIELRLANEYNRLWLEAETAKPGK